MDMQKVTSSNIDSIGHDPVRQVLAVKFKSGKTHEYGGFTPAKFSEMQAAPSVGSYFAKNVKDKHPPVPPAA